MNGVAHIPEVGELCAVADLSPTHLPDDDKPQGHGAVECGVGVCVDGQELVHHRVHGGGWTGLCTCTRRMRYYNDISVNAASKPSITVW